LQCFARARKTHARVSSMLHVAMQYTDTASDTDLLESPSKRRWRFASVQTANET